MVKRGFAFDPKTRQIAAIEKNAASELLLG